MTIRTLGVLIMLTTIATVMVNGQCATPKQLPKPATSVRLWEIVYTEARHKADRWEYRDGRVSRHEEALCTVFWVRFSDRELDC
jgi:hypothetical protein